MSLILLVRIEFVDYSNSNNVLSISISNTVLLFYSLTTFYMKLSKYDICLYKLKH